MDDGQGEQLPLSRVGKSDKASQTADILYSDQTVISGSRIVLGCQSDCESHDKSSPRGCLVSIEQVH